LRPQVSGGGGAPTLLGPLGIANLDRSKDSVILCIIQHCQNPLESTSTTMLVTQYFLGGNVENKEKFSQESRSAELDSNQEQPAHEL
jgi:hypothetical protein